MAYSELPWRPFLGHQAWSWTTLRRGNVFYYVYKGFFYFCRFFTFLTFLFLFERFFTYMMWCAWSLDEGQYSWWPPRPSVVFLVQRKRQITVAKSTSKSTTSFFSMRHNWISGHGAKLLVSHSSMYLMVIRCDCSQPSLPTVVPRSAQHTSISQFISDV